VANIIAADSIKPILLFVLGPRMFAQNQHNAAEFLFYQTAAQRIKSYQQ
jgi:hypothetical protein